MKFDFTNSVNLWYAAYTLEHGVPDEKTQKFIQIWYLQYHDYHEHDKGGIPVIFIELPEWCEKIKF